MEKLDARRATEQVGTVQKVPQRDTQLVERVDRDIPESGHRQEADVHLVD